MVITHQCQFGVEDGGGGALQVFILHHVKKTPRVGIVGTEYCGISHAHQYRMRPRQASNSCNLLLIFFTGLEKKPKKLFPSGYSKMLLAKLGQYY